MQHSSTSADTYTPIEDWSVRAFHSRAGEGLVLSSLLCLEDPCKQPADGNRTPTWTGAWVLAWPAVALPAVWGVRSRWGVCAGAFSRPSVPLMSERSWAWTSGLALISCCSSPHSRPSSSLRQASAVFRMVQYALCCFTSCMRP